MKYRLKPAKIKEIEAMQYSPQNQEALFAWAKEAYDAGNLKQQHLGVLTLRSVDGVAVNVGDGEWLVKQAGGGLTSMSNNAFLATFEPIPEPAPEGIVVSDAPAIDKAANQ